MVMPDRLVPGTKARHWANPITSTWRKDRCSSRRTVRPNRSAKYSTTPNATMVQATTSMWRKAVPANFSTASPTISAGMVPTMRKPASLAPGSRRPPANRTSPIAIRATSRQK